MKKYIVVLAGMILLAFSACTPKQKIITAVPDTAPSIEGQILTCLTNGCDINSMFLYQYDGVGFKLIQTFDAMGTDTFQVIVPMSGHQFYYAGPAENNLKPIVLGKEDNITMNVNCGKLRSSKVLNSPINDAYNWGITEARTNQNRRNQLARNFQRTLMSGDQEKLGVLVKQFADIDQDQLALLDTLNTIDPFVAKLAGTKTYLSYQNNNKGKYENELDYFVDETFGHIDLKDPQLDHLPAIYEQFNDFSKVLASINLPPDLLKSHLDKVLAQIPPDGMTYKYALGGTLHGLQAQNNPAFAEYAKMYLNKYEGTDSAGLEKLKAQMENAQSFIPGGEAPDFTQNTPEGTPMSLSDLRGKVVLIDFWASWCGPCRKENPNVVRIYNKYKDKGFDILGVSLDRSKTPWVNAIKKDGLPWHHISDLKGWKNEAAATYSVRSIPHTVLIDQEGKIIARNLRGPQLEEMLKKVFAE